ncbi:hypothetical protein PGTUg99_014123 [Puccinia graminis f. sp. tritici]|uniref:Uncharacterized protein n=1 Tax=Puccinia graminis f. sp. tritici TaxID=56615 RepID=A0A5B0Q1E3_PUCGR|nr:hypothetical protein PGTUg99_014123 [Puccinia graminis f. sp. tritici]
MGRVNPFHQRQSQRLDATPAVIVSDTTVTPGATDSMSLLAADRPGFRAPKTAA